MEILAPPASAELEHRYGPRVRILGDPYSNALLARIGSPDVRPPQLLELVRVFYNVLLSRVAASEFPALSRRVPTRMREHTERGVWEGRAIDPHAKVVIANVMRAGNLPSLTCFETLCSILDPENVRIDHFYFARKTDPHGKVIGVDSSGSKVGGAIEGSVLLIPDPMGATGGTTIQTLKAYTAMKAGAPKKIVAMHLIVTPEYLRRVLAETDDVVVFAGRVDRGMSPPDVLAAVPGAHFDRESGLNEVQYIVPGAGGLGEVLTNAFC
jgi:uracil phosphoribosyltransferase